MPRKLRASLLETPDSEEPLTSIDFGVVPENTTASKTVWLKNLEDFEIYDVEVYLENDDVKHSAIDVVQPMEAKPVHFTWTVKESSIALKQPFRILCKMMKQPE